MSKEPPAITPSPRSDSWKLYLLGFLTLFLELVLIRYLAGNIWNLGYFPNLVLLAVFVGMGFGFLLHHYIPRRTSSWLFHGSILTLLILVVFVRFLSPALPGFGTFGAEIGGEIFFTATEKEAVTESYLSFGLWFVAVVVIFAFLSQRTAKLFRLFAPLKAYTLDISGSCCGILSFMLLSWLQVPAHLWFVVVLVLYLAAMGRSAWWVRLSPIVPFALIVLIAHGQDTFLMSRPQYTGELQVYWSPYQKVEYIDYPPNTVARRIYVNGIAHQSMHRADQVLEDIYRVPYEERRKAGMDPYRTVLIIGAGAGNDTAAALMNGAERVDAVEIDPVIADLGRRYHPAQPYSDPRVTLTIDDARAFMTRTTDRYDLIIFALTDSLVKVSSMAQLRLENYLFTEDSIRKAFGMLDETGDVFLYNDYRRGWLIEKYQRMIHAATGKYPILVHQEGTTGILLVGRRRSLEAPPAFREARIDIPTDDWPFPYLRQRRMPGIYAGALAAVGSLVLLMAFLLHGLGRRREAMEGSKGPLTIKLAFVFMGVAFLLLETKSIVQFSLLFGTTWLNTSLVFLAVLLLVLAANWCALLLRHRSVLPIVYVLLIASCLIGFSYPVSNLLAVESGLLRFVLASLMTFSPIFFANLIFSVSFRDQKVAEHIFGWNLLGASAGGLLEYTSMAIGYNALAIIVALCYTLVILLLMAARRTAGSPHPTRTE